MGVAIDLCGKTQERLFGNRQFPGTKVVGFKSGQSLDGPATHAKEIAVTVGAVGARVLRGVERGNHLLVFPAQMSIRKDQRFQRSIMWRSSGRWVAKHFRMPGMSGLPKCARKCS